ncbi:MAG: hypothetical protein ACLGIB_09750 [Actinomycetota bacterium]
MTVALVFATPTPATSSQLVSSFDSGLGTLVAVGFDSRSSSVLVYAAFGDSIREFSTTGQPLATIPRPGQSSNDFDIDVTEVAVTVGQGSVPAGGLIVTNGEVDPQKLFGVDRAGTVLGQLDLTGTLVGGSYHATRNSMFVVDWTADVLRELDPSTGSVLNEFPVMPYGSPTFDVFYGDVSVSPGGNLFVVSSSQDFVRELTPTGGFVRDYEVGSLGVTGMSGIDFDGVSGDAWIVSYLNGTVYRVALEPSAKDRVVSTDQDDNLEGTSGDDTIYLQGGDDTYNAGDGEDSVYGDAGQDQLAGGGGSDLIDGGADNDRLIGGAGGDTLKGSGGNDTLTGDGVNEITGSSARPYLAVSGPDLLLGGGGADKLIGGGGHDRFNGGPGRDVCLVDSRKEKGQAKGCETIRLRRSR